MPARPSRARGQESPCAVSTGSACPARVPSCSPGVQHEGRLSIVTTAPNADVALVHDRIPLVLGPGEFGVWLGPDFARLADRSGIQLATEPER